VLPADVNKAERKGRTREEVERIICWLTGYDQTGLVRQIEQEKDRVVNQTGLLKSVDKDRIEKAGSGNVNHGRRARIIRRNGKFGLAQILV
jgi:hypothetical protein